MVVRWLLRILAGLGVLALAVVALGAWLLNAEAPPQPRLNGRLEPGAIRIGAMQRTYLVYAPARTSAKPPLLIAFHGSMGDPQSLRVATGYRFDELADRHGFVVAYPQGYRGNWNDCRKAADYPARALNVDDIGFVDALVERLRRERNIDASRVFVTGASNGAAFVLRLAVERPDRIAGAAAFAGSLPTPANSVCKVSGRPVPIMLVNGTRDPIVPYRGGEVTLFGFASRGEVISVPASARYFAGLAGAAGPLVGRIEPRARGDRTWVERSTWRVDGRPVVELLSVHGGGHVVPQPAYRPQRLLGRATTAIDGPAEAWAFFQRQASAKP